MNKNNKKKDKEEAEEKQEENIEMENYEVARGNISLLMTKHDDNKVEKLVNVHKTSKIMQDMLRKWKEENFLVETYDKEDKKVNFEENWAQGVRILCAKKKKKVEFLLKSKLQGMFMTDLKGQKNFNNGEHVD